MKTVLFYIDEIRGQGRPKVNFKTNTVYQDPKDTEYKEKVKAAYLKANEKAAADFSTEAIEVYISIYKAIPKSYTKKRRYEILRNGEPPLIKPDVDNVAKIILDSLNGVAWADDKQVSTLTVKKSYTDAETDTIIIMLSTPTTTQEQF